MTLFSHQRAHVGWLSLLLVALWGLSQLDGFLSGGFLGISTKVWVALSVGDAIAHQIFVWFCWRSELSNQLLSRVMGKGAFRWYMIGFAVLAICRLVAITGLAIANAGTLPVHSAIFPALAVFFAIPAAYTLYSIRRYFGFQRALGADHFDARYRSMPLVRAGIFRYSSNAMYAYGFLALWIPGLALQSEAALAVALFSHLYIWVHYFVTEKPDMEFLYGPIST